MQERAPDGIPSIENMFYLKSFFAAVSMEKEGDEVTVDAVVSSTRIFGRRWSPEQLRTMAEVHTECQRDVEHMRAHLALIDCACQVDTGKIRSMISRTMGTLAGCYEIAAALQFAQLALAFPQLLTRHQFTLLVRPLEAAESLEAEATENLLTAVAGTESNLSVLETEQAALGRAA